MKFKSLLNGIKTYEAGKPMELLVREYGIKPGDIIKLASNENPYGTSPAVIKSLNRSIDKVSMYPDDSAYELKSALASHFDMLSENIIIGAGSDQIIEFVINSICDTNSKILMAKTTFAMYEIYGRLSGATILKTQSHEHNIDDFKDIYKKHKPNIIFLCLPNNPLGECLNTDEVYAFLDSIDKNTLVVIDGAYQEYARYKDPSKVIDPKDITTKYSNTICLGTFSKVYGLGGLRVGYGISNRNTIATLHKLRPPFNITTLSLQGAIEALKDQKFVHDTVEKNFEQMIKYEEFADKKGLKYIDSYTNFIFIYMETNSKELCEKLLKKGLIVRDMTSYGLNAIRITIGTKKQNDTVLEVLDKLC